MIKYNFLLLKCIALTLIKSIFLLVMVSACSSDKDTEANDLSTTSNKPTILFVSSAPADNAQNVEINSLISLEYSETIEGAQFELDFALSAGNEQIKGSHRLQGNTIIFSPETPLTASTQYQIQISGSNQSKILETKTLGFITEEEQPISVTQTSPAATAQNISLTSLISIIFSKDVSGSDVGIDLQVKQGSTVIEGQTQIADSTLTFTPTTPFNELATIDVSVNETSQSGQQINNYQWSFSTLSKSGTICNNFYPQDFQLVSGQDNSPIASSSKPGKNVVVTDPAYKTCVVRMTNHNNETPSGFARAEYSRKQAINANNTILLALAEDGFWHVYDANTGDYIKILNGPASDADLRWDTSNPDLLYYTGTFGGMRVYELNIQSNTNKEIGNFTGRLPWNNAARAWTKAEGTSSADGRYWGVQVETENFAPLGLMVWDKLNDVIVGTWDFASNNVGRPDHTSMSPSGEYIVASWDGNNLGTTAFSRDFTKQVKLHHKSEHSDLALLPNGNDAYIAVDYQANAGDVFMVELQTGTRTTLFESYLNGTATAFHFSGKAYQRPGWALVSTYGGSGSKVWMHDKVFAVELKANPRILHIAHHHSKANGYWTEPHATVNQDFTRIIFNSNWEKDSATDIDIYQVKIPYSALE